MTDLEEFTKNLQIAADRAFPNKNRAYSRYRDVSVLLLRWEDDDMNVEWELEDLQKAFSKYGFDTERWLIPSQRSHLKLNNKVSNLVEKYNDQGSLVIVYYAGHGYTNDARRATWAW